MSSVVMAPVKAESYTESYTKWVEDDFADIPFLGRLQVSSSTKKSTRLLAVYPIFLSLASLLAVFFAVSLVLAFTTPYFLDWGSALVGFLGTAGLSAVAWFSKREVQS